MGKSVDTWLLELPRTECEERLRSAVLGRLGVVMDGRPLVFPMCHVFVDGELAFPTNTGTKMHAALSWPYVAYEVDGIEPDGLAAWSVMVTGHAEEITNPDRKRRLASLRDAPWRNSPTLRWVRLIPEDITGRRILTASALDAEAAAP